MSESEEGKLKRIRREVVQNAADYVFQRESWDIESNNEEKEKSQHHLLAVRDVEMEIEHEVKNCDSRTRVIFSTLVLRENGVFRKRNIGRLHYMCRY